MLAISRFSEGVTLNPKEYVLDSDGNVMLFDAPEGALIYLNDAFGADLSVDEYEHDQGIYIEEWVA